MWILNPNERVTLVDLIWNCFVAILEHWMEMDKPITEVSKLKDWLINPYKLYQLRWVRKIDWTDFFFDKVNWTNLSYQ